MSGNKKYLCIIKLLIEFMLLLLCIVLKGSSNFIYLFIHYYYLCIYLFCYLYLECVKEYSRQDFKTVEFLKETLTFYIY